MKLTVRDRRRWVIFVSYAVTVTYIAYSCFSRFVSPADLGWWSGHPAIVPSSPASITPPLRAPHRPDPASVQRTHHELFSVSTADRAYFDVDLGPILAINPNVLPHPVLDDTYLVVAQRQADLGSPVFSEVLCPATFRSGALRCSAAPTPLPIAPTRSAAGSCAGDLAVLELNVGPHDARAFHGPAGPLVVFGSNSRFTCFGQFVQDLAALAAAWPPPPQPPPFPAGTEMQAPGGAYAPVEKNWFLFWGADGTAYVHQSMWPARVMARLEADGAVGDNLAGGADAACLGRLLPTVPVGGGPRKEAIHQTTNSLEVTMCSRADPACAQEQGNTFLFTVVQHKVHHGVHASYEPYVVVFRRRAPFEVYAVSEKPLWIHGRAEGEMVYVVAMSWKSKALKYHGYLDDVLFISFGVDDSKMAGIDVAAGEVLAGLGMCGGF